MQGLSQQYFVTLGIGTDRRRASAARGFEFGERTAAATGRRPTTSPALGSGNQVGLEFNVAFILFVLRSALRTYLSVYFRLRLGAPPRRSAANIRTARCGSVGCGRKLTQRSSGSSSSSSATTASRPCARASAIRPTATAKRTITAGSHSPTWTRRRSAVSAGTVSGKAFELQIRL